MAKVLSQISSCGIFGRAAFQGDILACRGLLSSGSCMRVLHVSSVSSMGLVGP